MGEPHPAAAPCHVPFGWSVLCGGFESGGGGGLGRQVPALLVYDGAPCSEGGGRSCACSRGKGGNSHLLLAWPWLFINTSL